MHKIGLTIILALGFCLAANAATFTLAGDNGLAGTITIDTTTGSVTSGTMTYGPDTFTFNVQLSLGPLVHIQAINGPGTKLLHLLIQASSLVGYAGGNLCGTNNPCGSGESDIYCTACSAPAGAYPPGYPCCGGTATWLSHVTLT